MQEEAKQLEEQLKAAPEGEEKDHMEEVNSKLDKALEAITTITEYHETARHQALASAVGVHPTADRQLDQLVNAAQIKSLLEERGEQRLGHSLLDPVVLGVVEQLMGQEGVGVLDTVEVVRQPQLGTGTRDQIALLLCFLRRDAGVQQLQEVDLTAHIVGKQLRCQLPGVIGDVDFALELHGSLVKPPLRDPTPRTRDVQPGVHRNDAVPFSTGAHVRSLWAPRRDLALKPVSGVMAK